jgi:hypothetical protein
MKHSKRLCAILVAALALAGPLGSWPAMAQAPQPGPAYSGPPGPSAVPSTGAKVGAGFLNVVYVPGKAIICSAGVLVSGVLMLATFGSAYRDAVRAFEEGCGGRWALTAEQVSGPILPKDDTPG